MVIDSNSGLPPTSGGARNRVDTRSTEARPEGEQTRPADTGPKAAAEVSLSAGARLLNQVENNLGSADVDSERVEAIRQAIAEGRYSINAERIAERMLEQDTLF